MRNAIQALQILACSPQSNPNLPTPASRGSGVLARSSSHPPDAICWDPPRRMSDASTQTDWPVDLFESWIRANPQRVLRILELDPDTLSRQPPSPTPSPSSPPPPPYEPLSPIVGTPPQSPSLAQGNHTNLISFFTYYRKMCKRLKYEFYGILTISNFSSLWLEGIQLQRMSDKNCRVEFLDCSLLKSCNIQENYCFRKRWFRLR